MIFQFIYELILLFKFNLFLFLNLLLLMQQGASRFQRQFTVEGEIGTGTFGTVKKCIWKINNQLCAVKCIDNVNGFNLQKIQEEAQIMQDAQSDYSLELYDHFFDQENSQYILVMPYCKFGSLEKYIYDDWLIDDLLLFMYQITEAFVDLSEKQITHLDLKPENILLKAPGQYLVCDFGCSKVIQNLALSKNFLKLSHSKGLGTQQYASPQIKKNGLANKYSDVWSLGVILYKMIYHKTPFKNTGMMSFGAFKTTFQGYKPQLQPIVTILRNMLNQDGRPSWKKIRQSIYEILNIQNTVDIVTSTTNYTEYVKNVAVVGTCLMHHVDRIREQLEICHVNYKSLIKAFLQFILKLTTLEINSDMCYFFQFTKNRMKNDDKIRIQKIHQQTQIIIKDRKFQLQQNSVPLSKLKIALVKEIKTFAQNIMKMPAKMKQKIQQTPKYEFFKVKKILQFVITQNGDNLKYFQKRKLAQTVKFLVCS